MRTVRIIRPRMMTLAAKKLHVLLDGNKAGALGNGKELTLQMDENGHDITINGGAFSSKKFTCTQHIPAGRYNYCFQTGFMLSNTNIDGEEPILRPCGGTVLQEDPARLRSMIGVTVTKILTDEKTRDEMRANPQTLIGVYLEENGWKAAFENAGSSVVVFESEYSGSGASGFLVGALNNAAQRAAVSTPESRAQTHAFLFDNYFRFLPDYEITADRKLHFRGDV